MPAVYDDTLTRADSTTSLGTPTTGGPYVAAYGTWGVSSNKAYAVTDVDGNLAVVDTGLVNGTFLATIQGGLAATNFRNAGLVVRYLDLNNFLWIVFQAGQVALQKVDTGAYTWLNGGATPTPDATDIRVRIVCNAAVVTVYCDDVLRFSHTLSGAETTKYTAAGYTRFGMRLNKGGTPTVAARWDNLTAAATAVNATLAAVTAAGLGAAPAATLSASLSATFAAATAAGLGTSPAASLSAGARLSAVAAAALGQSPAATVRSSSVLGAAAAAGAGQSPTASLVGATASTFVASSAAALGAAPPAVLHAAAILAAAPAGATAATPPAHLATTAAGSWAILVAPGRPGHLSVLAHGGALVAPGRTAALLVPAPRRALVATARSRRLVVV